jgi:hypothetical protein
MDGSMDLAVRDLVITVNVSSVQCVLEDQLVVQEVVDHR